MNNPESTPLLPAVGKPVVKIFGVGNAGMTLLDTVNTPEFAGANFVAVNTDAASLAA
jgi:cell division GTPase FtsZ